MAHTISQQYKDRDTRSLRTAPQYLDSGDFNLRILLDEELVAVGALSARQLQVGFGPQHLHNKITFNQPTLGNLLQYFSSRLTKNR
jgi:hypothetical protein